MRGDFIGFSFGEHHSEDFNLVRVSSGDRFSAAILNEIEDKTIAVAGKKGRYFFGSQIGKKPFVLNLAFDNINEFQLASLGEWLNGEELKRLIFDETPYKYYLAKIAENPEINFMPFEIWDDFGRRNVYKGEVQLKFVTYSNNAYVTDKKGLDSYKDLKGQKYDLEYLPLWFSGSQLIPKCELNQDIRIPKTNHLLYVGGFKEADLNLRIKFNTKDEIIQAIQGDIEKLEKAAADLGAEIDKKNKEISELAASIDSINKRLAALNTLIVENAAKIESHTREIIRLGDLIPVLDERIKQKDSQISKTDNEITKIQTEIDNLIKAINDLKEVLSDLEKLENPNASAVEKIEQIKAEIADKEELKTKKEEEKATKEEEKRVLENEKATIVIEKTQAQEKTNQLQQEIETMDRDSINAKNEIADLTEQIKVPTQKIEELNTEITQLTEQKTKIEIQVQTLKKEGVPLTGEKLVITKKHIVQDKEITEENQECSITLDDTLKGKTLVIRTSNHDIAAYDDNGIRYDLFSEMSGDYFTAKPNGIQDILVGKFNADASMSNRIELQQSSSVNASSLLNRYIVFKEDSKIGANIEHSVAKIVGTQVGNDGKVTLTLSNSYTLTKGLRHFAVLKGITSIDFNNIKFIKEVEFDCPYLYY